MATFKAYPNGATMGHGNAAPVGGKRGSISGWSAASVRRHKRWLYAVQAPDLNGRGDAITLTMRDAPEDHRRWEQLRKRLMDRLRDGGALRWHWVVEWQRRGTPHLHMAVYWPDGSDRGGWDVVGMWRDIASAYGVELQAQHVTAITGPVGWLKYLSKHASRGVAHYQRQGMPAGWEKTGRLWGYGGDWPIAEPVEGALSTDQMWRVRRMVQRYAIAQARSAALQHAVWEPKKAAAAWDSVGFLRRMRKCSDRALSSVRGISEWVPGPVFLEMALCAGWSGEVPE